MGLENFSYKSSTIVCRRIVDLSGEDPLDDERTERDKTGDEEDGEGECPKQDVN